MADIKVPKLYTLLYPNLFAKTANTGTVVKELPKIVEKLKNMYRQGDVLLVKIAAIPKNAKPVKRDNGKLVLAYGEATGHSHVVDAPPESATLFTTKDNERFLRLVAPAPLVHEEHGDIKLEPGTYRQIPQEEWTDDMERPVARMTD